MVGFLAGTYFFGLLTIAGIAYTVGGYGPYPKAAVVLWITALAWLIGAPMVYWEWGPPEQADVGVLVVHRTLLDHLLFRYHPLCPFADSTVEIGQSGSSFIMVNNSPIHEFFSTLGLRLERSGSKLLVSARILDKTGKVIVILNRGTWQASHNIDRSWDFNYKDDSLEVRKTALTESFCSYACCQIAFKFKVNLGMLQPDEACDW
jgi:hypothetical protein